MMNNFSFRQNQQFDDHPFKSQYQNHWANNEGYYQNKNYNFYDLNSKSKRARGTGEKYASDENHFTMYQDKFGNWYVVRNTGKSQETHQTQNQQQARDDPYDPWQQYERAQNSTWKNQTQYDDFASHYHTNFTSNNSKPYQHFGSDKKRRKYDSDIYNLQNLLLKRRIFQICMIFVGVWLYIIALESVRKGVAPNPMDQPYNKNQK